MNSYRMNSLACIATFCLPLSSFAIELQIRYCDTTRKSEVITVEYTDNEGISDQRFIDHFGAPLAHFKAANNYLNMHDDVCSALPKNTKSYVMSDAQTIHIDRLPFQVESVIPEVLTDIQKKFLQAENVRQWSQQWNMHNHIGVGVAAEGAWAQLRFTGLNKTYVAVIDSGVTKFMPEDLQGRLEMSQPYYFYVNDQDKVDVITSVIDTDLMQGPHGTAVAGVIAAQGPNVTGVAGDVDEIMVLPVKVFGHAGGAKTEAITMAMEWAAGIYSEDMASIAQLQPNQTPAKVINLSLGISRVGKDGLAVATESDWKNDILPVYCQAFQQSINKVNDLGVTVVISAGNSGQPVWNSAPAGCPNINAIVVEATNNNGIKADYSNYAVSDWPLQSLVLAAPGGEDAELDLSKGVISPGYCIILGQTESCLYYYLEGTSFSAPHVAGIAAMIYALKPDADVSYVKTKLSQSTWGNNVINAQEAVRQTVVAEQSNDAQSDGAGGANSTGVAVAAGAGALASALALILFM
ncbi:MULTISPECIES: S8 family serine peptidase [Cysteiniphilum]|uniref:S8 family serine peptidase n=1 Tax=Cysteiniphilum TaxID=2056696 RepID=UPI0017831668|nr:MULTISPECIES: S8 family serine peptidase [Cysteiniphilum]